jgi:hypothetical protein
VTRRRFHKSARRTLQIGGQAPKVKWRRNTGGGKRTIKEAVAIAKRHGVRIPDDVVFYQAGKGQLAGTWEDLFGGGGMETARGPTVRQQTDGYVYWRDHYNKRGQIPFFVHPDILTSDEAIVAVIAHEMFELSELGEVFFHSMRRRMIGTDYSLQTAPGHPGNFHDQAWDAADEAVLRMRKGRR